MAPFIIFEKMTSIDSLYTNIQQELGFSKQVQREKWAIELINLNVDLAYLGRQTLPLPYPISLRFTWLLSDIGNQSAEYLFRFLPSLFELQKTISLPYFSHSFASYWKICGIPEQNESEALDHLLALLQLKTTSNTIKERALDCLLALLEKHPAFVFETQQTINRSVLDESKGISKRVNSIMQWKESNNL